MHRLDQGMARDAAQILPPAEAERAPELRTRFRRLPVHLQTSGLAATYAFLAARAEAESTPALQAAYGEVAQRIRSRLAQRELLPNTVATTPAPGVHREVLQHLGEMDIGAYTRATAEVRLLLSWLRRLAEALYAAPDGRKQT